MKRTTPMTIAALVVAIATSAAVAPAYAQDNSKRDVRPGQGFERHFERNNDGPRGFFLHRERGPGKMQFALRGGAGQRGNVVALVCSPRGADRLEHLLLSIAQRVDPTTEQQPLYDAFKTAALTAQTDFSDACTEARPARTAGAERPDLADRMKAQFAVEKAHVEAMTNVIPAFEAFYDSLSDEQKQALEPRRGRQHQEGRRVDGPRPPVPPAPPAPNADQPPQNG